MSKKRHSTRRNNWRGKPQKWHKELTKVERKDNGRPMDKAAGSVNDTAEQEDTANLSRNGEKEGGQKG